MRFAYADPPYLGCAGFYRDMHPEWAAYDHIDTHKALIDRLSADYPDGWVMSLHEPSLRHILPLCPDDCRVLSWVKPFASFKPGVGVAYAWEPLILRGGRKRPRTADTTRDWFAASITMRKGLTGAKPPQLMRWVLDVLYALPGDTVDDLFPGTGACGEVFRAHLDRSHPIGSLFEGAA